MKITLFVVVIALIIAASAVSFYLLKSAGQNTVATIYTQPVYTTPSPQSDKTTDLNQDLNNTTVASPDSDLQDLNSTASSL